MGTRQLIKFNSRNRCNGLSLLKNLPDKSTSLVFFDPQYRSILAKMNYGNEGERQRERALLPQMSDETIRLFAVEIERVLKPSGHAMLWIDKFILCNYAARPFFQQGWTVDLITWDKMRIGMGYRTRRQGEYLMIIQKPPTRAKDVWSDHGIPDVWKEKFSRSGHPHAKPKELQRRLIEAVTKKGDLVVDPCAGSYVVLDLCRETGRKFLGCDPK